MISLIKFLQLTNAIIYPPQHRAKLSTYHSAIISYAIDHFENTRRFKNQILSILNTISYKVVMGDALPTNWVAENPAVNLELLPEDILRDGLDSNLYISSRDIDWSGLEEHSVTEDTSPVSNSADSSDVLISSKLITPKPVESVASIVATLQNKKITSPTPKEDLYLKPPTIPSFDANEIYISGWVDGNELAIYKTLPLVPTRQNEISVTTDIDTMLLVDLLNLFPNQIIRTRYSSLYNRVPNIYYHELLGSILPICDFDQTTLIDNVIRYPHFYKMMRQVDNQLEPFCKYIEIDGQLYDTLAIWPALPESDVIPKNAEFIKDYVIRRYLLERDKLHIQHKYPLVGTLDPFLTLFMPGDEYIKLGYSDLEFLARSCVKSRVAYKKSHNPIYRRLQPNA